MPKSDFIYSDPTIVNFTTSTGPTPYGIYDNDTAGDTFPIPKLSNIFL